jgi:hypothetical protein
MIGGEHHPLIGGNIGGDLIKRSGVAGFALGGLSIGNDLLQGFLRRKRLSAFFPDGTGFGSGAIGGNQISAQGAFNPVESKLQNKNCADEKDQQNRSKGPRSSEPFIEIFWLNPILHGNKYRKVTCKCQENEMVPVCKNGWTPLGFILLADFALSR